MRWLGDIAASTGEKMKYNLGSSTSMNLKA